MVLRYLDPEGTQKQRLSCGSRDTNRVGNHYIGAAIRKRIGVYFHGVAAVSNAALKDAAHSRSSRYDDGASPGCRLG